MCSIEDVYRYPLSKPAQMCKLYSKQQKDKLTSYKIFLVDSAIHAELDKVLLTLYLHLG